MSSRRSARGPGRERRTDLGARRDRRRRGRRRGVPRGQGCRAGPGGRSFAARYGEGVLLEPTRSGLNLLPWLFPIAAVIVGAAIWLTILRRRPGWSPEAAGSDAEGRRIEVGLAGP